MRRIVCLLSSSLWSHELLVFKFTKSRAGISTRRVERRVFTGQDQSGRQVSALFFGVHEIDNLAGQDARHAVVDSKYTSGR